MALSALSTAGALGLYQDKLLVFEMECFVQILGWREATTGIWLRSQATV